MKKSQTIGLIISELTRSRTGHDLTFNIICGVNDRATEAGYDLVLSTTDPSRQEQVPYMELCRRRQLDGVILMGMRTDDPYLKEVVESSVPCVLIDVRWWGTNAVTSRWTTSGAPGWPWSISSPKDTGKSE